jgi:hypothetical protein
VWPYGDETFHDSISIPRSRSAFDSTTYIYKGIKVLQDAKIQDWRPRCIKLFAMHYSGIHNDRPTILFECRIAVSDVSHASKKNQKLSDENARLAAASIALSGRYTNPNRTSFERWQQYKLYPWG